MRLGTRARKGERGVTLVIMAIIVFLTLGMAALAIDYGMIKTDQAEAQRAMDAAALAGASAFQDPGTGSAHIVTARARAKDYASKHTVGGQPIDTSEIYSIPVDTIKGRVDVYYSRAGIRLWFANTFGMNTMGIKSHAAAEADVGGVQTGCAKPFLLPDIWHETKQDLNSNRMMDPNEAWHYEPASDGGTDTYLRYDPNVTDNPLAPQTGYGSAYRNSSTYPNDKGLPLLLHPAGGNSNYRQGNWYDLLDGPEPNVAKQIESGCITAGIGQTPAFKTGSTNGGVKNGINALFKLDDKATWNDVTHTIDNSTYGANGENSPRVIIVGLFDPVYIKGQNRNNTNKPDPGITFNNFAKIFIDKKASASEDLSVRFVGFVPGGGGGPIVCTTCKILRLVE